MKSYEQVSDEVWALPDTTSFNAGERTAKAYAVEAIKADRDQLVKVVRAETVNLLSTYHASTTCTCRFKGAKIVPGSILNAPFPKLP